MFDDLRGFPFLKLFIGNRIEKNILPFKLGNGKCSAMCE